MKWLQKNWLRFVFCLGLIYTVGTTLYFGEKAKPAEMGVALTTGAIIMAFGFLDRIKLVRTASFEMEMKEKLENAYATIENLAELTVSLATPIVYLLSHANIPGLLNDRVEMKNQLIKRIQKFSSDPNEIRSVSDIFDGYWIGWYISQIVSQLHTKLDEDCINELRKLAYETDHRELAHLEPGRVRQILSDHLHDKNSENMVSQLEHFILYRKFQ